MLQKVFLFGLGLILGACILFALTPRQDPCVFNESFSYGEPANDSGYVLPERTDFHAFFSKSLLDDLNMSYVKGGDEYVYCLNGWRNGTDFFFSSTSPAYTYSNSSTDLVFDSAACKNSLGTIHSHTRGKNRCIPSFTDIYSWGYMHNQVQVIQCGPEDFAVIKMPEGSELFDLSETRWDIYTPQVDN